MIRYLLQFIIIILVILPFYLKLRKPWKRERGREIALAVFVLFMIGLLALALQGKYQTPSRNFAGSCLGAGACFIIRKKFPRLDELAK